MPPGSRWGSVARRGASGLSRPYEGGRDDAAGVGYGRNAPANGDAGTSVERWERQPDQDERKSSSTPKGHPAGPRRQRQLSLPDDVAAELRVLAGPRRSEWISKRMTAAVVAYDRDHYAEARQILDPLAKEVPDSPTVRELYGLVLYRLGRWRKAAKELEAFHRLSGSFDQHPAIADCERVLGNHRAAEERLEQLRRASPGADLLAEGRLVLAGSYADRGKLDDAIALLERHARPLRHPTLRHLRTWYALADLYERAGELPKARQLFSRVASYDPDLGSAQQRASGLT